MKKAFLLIGAAVLCATLHLFAQAEATLRAGDTFDMRISGVPGDDQATISSNYTVDGDGFMNLPLFGKLKVSGRSASQVQTLIEHTYVEQQIFTHPTVTLSIAASARFVNVGGPGVKGSVRVAYTPDMTLMTAILAAGDFNEFAKQEKVNLIRGKQVTIVNCKEVRKNPAKDVAVLPGDSIYVPETMF